MPEPTVVRDYCATCHHFELLNPNGFGECHWGGPGADYSGWATWPRLHSGRWCGQHKPVVTVPTVPAPAEPGVN